MNEKEMSSAAGHLVAMGRKYCMEMKFVVLEIYISECLKIISVKQDRRHRGVEN